jgi:hypothetical protein
MQINSRLTRHTKVLTVPCRVQEVLQWAVWSVHRLRTWSIRLQPATSLCRHCHLLTSSLSPPNSSNLLNPSSRVNPLEFQCSLRSLLCLRQTLKQGTSQALVRDAQTVQMPWCIIPEMLVIRQHPSILSWIAMAKPFLLSSIPLMSALFTTFLPVLASIRSLSDLNLSLL